MGTTTRSIALVAAVGVVILVLALALGSRNTPGSSPDGGGRGRPA